MAMDNIESVMQGVGTNPKLVFRAPQYISEEATLIYDSQYFEGKAVRGTNPGQQLMETGWITPDILFGITSIVAVWNSDSTNNYFTTIELLIERRDAKTKTYVGSSTHSFRGYAYYDKVTGSTTIDTDVDLVRSKEYLTFDDGYDYKLSVKIGIMGTGCTYVDLSYFYIQHHQKGAIQLGYQPRFTTTGETYKADSVPVIDFVKYTVDTTYDYTWVQMSSLTAGTSFKVYQVADWTVPMESLKGDVSTPYDGSGYYRHVNFDVIYSSKTNFMFNLSGGAGSLGASAGQPQAYDWIQTDSNGYPEPHVSIQGIPDTAVNTFNVSTIIHGLVYPKLAGGA